MVPSALYDTTPVITVGLQTNKLPKIWPQRPLSQTAPGPGAT
jgi:hypothetical protein